MSMCEKNVLNANALPGVLGDIVKMDESVHAQCMCMRARVCAPFLKVGISLFSTFCMQSLLQCVWLGVLVFFHVRQR